jgi:Fic family protein
MRIEAVKQSIQTLPMTRRVLEHLRETARLFSTHYSTMIEGNRLTQEEVSHVIADDGHFPGRERDEAEVRGYYAALDEVERLAARSERLSERILQNIHALVMSSGRKRVKPTPYRDGQNVIRDSRSKAIVYMPPEAKDVPKLMKELIDWANQQDQLPVPLKAAITHYQFATIHPYYDGNGRTARLLTTLILHLGSYDLKGLYSLEEYYARDLKGYYSALTVGPSHNYYMGRADADITQWVSYFIEGMAASFDKVHVQTKAEAESGAKDQSGLLRRLNPRQRKALALFRESVELTGKDVAGLFGFQARAAARLCQDWITDGFIEVADPSKKARKYRLAPAYEALVQDIVK